MTTTLTRRSLRDELAFLLDSTVDLPADAYDRDTLLMRLETAFISRTSSWKCAARSANVGANDPQDCDYQFCGCSPEASRALEVACESGALMPREAEKLRGETRR